MEYINKHKSEQSNIMVHEAFNKRRRIINLFRKELNITKKSFQKRLKKDKEFRHELINIVKSYGMSDEELKLLGINITKEVNNGTSKKEF